MQKLHINGARWQLHIACVTVAKCSRGQATSNCVVEAARTPGAMTDGVHASQLFVSKGQSIQCDTALQLHWHIQAVFHQGWLVCSACL